MATWSFDTAHSEVSFSVRHMMFAKVRGSFGRWTGEVGTDAAGALSSVRADLQVDSIDTHEADRDKHLRSADFFDAETFPTMSFRSAAVRGDLKGSFQIDGELSMHGVTRPVSLDVQYGGEGKDPWGNTRRGYRATTRINRTDFGLNWNAALELGGVLVGEEIEISIETELVQGA